MTTAQEALIASAATTAAAATLRNAETDHLRIDYLEAVLLDHGTLIEGALTHRFTPGMYIREIHMPAGSIFTSKIHRTEHPYVITAGRVSVFMPGGGVEVLEAPHIGITKAGSRRVLHVHTDTVWITFHPNPDNLTDIGEIEARIIERRELIPGASTYELYAQRLSEQRQTALGGAA